MRLTLLASRAKLRKNVTRGPAFELSSAATNVLSTPNYTWSRMARQEQGFDEDDEMSEILRLAIRKQEGSTGDLQQRLLDAADELGIPHSTIVEAEKEYRLSEFRRKEMAQYRKENRNGLRIHLGVYAIINVFLVLINLITLQEDKEIWFPYAILGWGIGVAIHAFVACRTVDWDDEEFQKWRAKRSALDDRAL